MLFKQSKQTEQDFSFFKKEIKPKHSVFKDLFTVLVRPYLLLSTILGATILTSCLLVSGSAIYRELTNSPHQPSQLELTLEKQKIHFNHALYSYRHLDKNNFLIALGQNKTNIKLVTDNTVQLQLKYDNPFSESNYTVEFKDNKIFKIYSENPTKAEQDDWMKTNNVFMTLRGAESVPSDLKLNPNQQIKDMNYRQMIIQFIN